MAHRGNFWKILRQNFAPGIRIGSDDLYSIVERLPILIFGVE